MLELKELYKNILSAFDAEDISEFSQKVFDCLISGKTDAFEKYLPLCPKTA